MAMGKEVINQFDSELDPTHLYNIGTARQGRIRHHREVPSHY